MPKSYPKEFREDVVRVPRNCEAGLDQQVVDDFGIADSRALSGHWLRAADVEDGVKPGTTTSPAESSTE